VLECNLNVILCNLSIIHIHHKKSGRQEPPRNKGSVGFINQHIYIYIPGQQKLNRRTLSPQQSSFPPSIHPSLSLHTAYSTKVHQPPPTTPPSVYEVRNSAHLSSNFHILLGNGRERGEACGVERREVELGSRYRA